MDKNVRGTHAASRDVSAAARQRTGEQAPASNEADALLADAPAEAGYDEQADAREDFDERLFGGEDRDRIGLTEAFESESDGGWTSRGGFGDFAFDDDLTFGHSRRNRMFGNLPELEPIGAAASEDFDVEDTAPEETAAPDAAEVNAYLEESTDEDMAAFFGDDLTISTDPDVQESKDIVNAKAEMPEFMKRSRRVRNVLIAVVILLLLVVAGAGVYLVHLFSESQEQAHTQAQEQQSGSMDEVEAIIESTGLTDAVTQAQKVTSAPNLVQLLGHTRDEAIELVGHGASIAGTTTDGVTLEGIAFAQGELAKANDALAAAQAALEAFDAETAQITAAAGGVLSDETILLRNTTRAPLQTAFDTAYAAVEQQTGTIYALQEQFNVDDGTKVHVMVRLSLTFEPADVRTGNPTVYLGLNRDGYVIEAGYSTSTTSLGYGDISFSDTVREEHIIETTLREAGVDIPDGSAVLPDDKLNYTTYNEDGTTISKEYCSFSGETVVNGQMGEWSAVLSYDYATANVSGNLGDTIRIVYVYINQYPQTVDLSF